MNLNSTILSAYRARKRKAWRKKTIIVPAAEETIEVFVNSNFTHQTQIFYPVKSSTIDDLYNAIALRTNVCRGKFYLRDRTTTRRFDLQEKLSDVGNLKWSSGSQYVYLYAYTPAAGGCPTDKHVENKACMYCDAWKPMELTWSSPSDNFLTLEWSGPWDSDGKEINDELSKFEITIVNAKPTDTSCETIILSAPSIITLHKNKTIIEASNTIRILTLGRTHEMDCYLDIKAILVHENRNQEANLVAGSYLPSCVWQQDKSPENCL